MFARLALLTSLGASAFLPAQAPIPKYLHHATVPLDLRGRFAFAFDEAANRVWVGARRGLFWVDLARGSLSGPFGRIQVAGDIECASDLGKVFVVRDGDQIASVDIRSIGQPVPVGVAPRVTEMVYEPERKELYVFGLTRKVIVFDAVAGQQVATIDLPETARRPAAIGGRVWFTLARRDGLFAIDGKTRTMALHPVEGRTAAPAAIEGDAATGQLFLAFAREIVAIDAASGVLRGRFPTLETAAIAFDPGTGVLLATRGQQRILVLRSGPQGLELLDELSWAGGNIPWLEPTRRGFLQLGEMATVSEHSEWSSASLVIWKAR
jgi:hypothetical protein